jgi:hypothetical protein
MGAEMNRVEAKIAVQTVITRILEDSVTGNFKFEDLLGKVVKKDFEEPYPKKWGNNFELINDAMNEMLTGVGYNEAISLIRVRDGKVKTSDRKNPMRDLEEIKRIMRENKHHIERSGEQMAAKNFGLVVVLPDPNDDTQWGDLLFLETKGDRKC